MYAVHHQPTGSLLQPYKFHSQRAADLERRCTNFVQQFRNWPGRWMSDEQIVIQTLQDFINGTTNHDKLVAFDLVQHSAEYISSLTFEVTNTDNNTKCRLSIRQDIVEVAAVTVDRTVATFFLLQLGLFGQRGDRTAWQRLFESCADITIPKNQSELKELLETKYHEVRAALKGMNAGPYTSWFEEKGLSLLLDHSNLPKL